MISSLNFKVVPLVAALRFLELLAAILDGAARLRECDAPYASGTVQAFRLALDVHDARFGNCHCATLHFVPEIYRARSVVGSLFNDAGANVRSRPKADIVEVTSPGLVHVFVQEAEDVSFPLAYTEIRNLVSLFGGTPNRRIDLEITRFSEFPHPRIYGLA
jgi:hypothetical protein